MIAGRLLCGVKLRSVVPENPNQLKCLTFVLAMRILGRGMVPYALTSRDTVCDHAPRRFCPPRPSLRPVPVSSLPTDGTHRVVYLSAADHSIGLETRDNAPVTLPCQETIPYFYPNFSSRRWVGHNTGCLACGTTHGQPLRCGTTGVPEPVTSRHTHSHASPPCAALSHAMRGRVYSFCLVDSHDQASRTITRTRGKTAGG